MANWRWECQTCQKAKACHGSGLCFPCLDDECKYEPFQNFATSSTKNEPSTLAYYTSNAVGIKERRIENISSPIVSEIETDDGMEYLAEFEEFLFCGGCGKTKEEAVEDAYKNLEIYLEELADS